MKRTLGSRFKRIGIWLARAAFVGVVGVVLLLALLWRERNQSLELPIPTGPFAVGRAIYDWTDDANLDTLAPVPGTKRELLVWIWYPSAAGQSVAMDDYVPAQMRAAAGPARGPMRFVTRDESKVHGHSIRDAEVSPRYRQLWGTTLSQARCEQHQPVGYSQLIQSAGADGPARRSVEHWLDATRNQ